MELGSGVVVVDAVKLRLSKTNALLLLALTVTDEKGVTSVNAANTGVEVMGARTETEPVELVKVTLPLDTALKPKKLIGCAKVKVRLPQVVVLHVPLKLATCAALPNCVE